jgi:hypothetical protein
MIAQAVGGMTTFEVLMIEAIKDGRVCPQPVVWQQLWEILPDRRRVGAGWEPLSPLILAAWWEDLQFREARPVSLTSTVGSEPRRGQACRRLSLRA